MFEQIKANIFTVHGIITSLIHLFLVVGAVTVWIGTQVYVLGNDPVAQMQGQPVKPKR
jgi:hypothetical protein